MAQPDPWDAALSAIRASVDDLGAWLAIWSARTEPDAHARRCASDAVDAIDAALIELHGIRAELVGEIRRADDQAAARADRAARPDAEQRVMSRAKDRRYREANREAIRERNRRYRAGINPEKERERARRYREANAENERERKRRWRVANREKANERARRRQVAAQAQTTDAARRHGYVWTGPELEIAARDDLTVEQIALMLGRTYNAVASARRRIRHDPRADFLAGLARQTREATRDGPRGSIPGAAAESPKPFAEVNASAATILGQRGDNGRAPEAP